MQVGQALREARLNRGIDLYEVQRVTKIRVQSLRAMEEDRWGAIAESEAEVQLAAYARFLGLDEQALLEQFRHPGEQEQRADRLAPGPIKPGGRLPRPSGRPRALLLGGLAAATVLIIGIVVVASLGTSNSGKEHGARGTHARSGSTSNSTASTTATAAAVSVELRSTADVWVCLVDQRQRALVDGETLTTDETRGPFDGKAFDATFGNGSVELTVNGQPVRVPPVSAPLGYRITPDGATRLAPSDEPTCS
jgi:cytoskeletal protein RodZ